ncbi:DUF4905 domain-containing protein [Arundinibacter roseus]|uniref:DUF4905 domain-containing protein n=1 Tax=Arundinibacter roseus TaxID=2070510 RepID=A0A4R4K1I0_9BACT|nr:DUF4905 domain-containing protein [Arundinibacter roseus]TDB61157.1 DUF4905 domain-containing protein [Arundinibacter roseus]
MLLPAENQSSFSFEQAMAIWRILPHPHPEVNTWAVELRDTEQKTVSWVVLDFTSQKLLWQTTPEATDWWSSLTAFTESAVYLHNYRYPDIPEPTDLLSVSVVDGSLQWALPGVVFVQEGETANQIVVAQKMGEGVTYRLCDADSGRLQRAVEPIALPPGRAEACRTPERYYPQDIYFDVLSSFLQKVVRVSQPLAIDYLEATPYIAFSYYIYIEEKVAQFLLVVNQKQEVVYHQILSEGRKGLSSSTLVWKNDHLLFLRTQNELISLNLTP